MIKPHQFIVLAGGTAVSLLLAVGLYFGANRWSAGTVEGDPFLPELAAQTGKIAGVAVTQGGGKLTVQATGKGWTVQERDGYPAKSEAVRTLLLALAEAKLIEAKTASAGKLALLELEDPAAKDAKSRGVRLTDASGKELANVVIGKTRWDAFGSGRGGIYVRRQNQTQSWLATGDPKVTSSITDWVDTKIVSNDVAKITRLTLEHPGEEPLVIEKGAPEAPKPPAPGAGDAKAAPAPPVSKDTKFHLAKMPEGKKLKKDASVDQIVDVFSSLDLEDVRKLAATPPGDMVSVLKLEQTGAPTLTVRARKDGKDLKQTWISVEAAGTDEATRKAADAINARAKGWEFRILDWKGEHMLKRRADLFETT